ncbi:MULTISPECIES: FAD:protein FMN transferase [unclassified Thioalkalivibrio]|uniref:FAD:protein FMN transferase n=1 Tax=unclassified Thioalkalivibrio TaxID=2621013 RepID=UPI00037B879B|nr:MULTISPECIES: FAD:protein FMN transferase [unclassified Thioalkalivibrio]
MPIPFPRTRQAFLGPILLAALALAGCDRDTPDTETLNFFAFGTIVDVTLYPAGAYDLEALESELQAELEILHTSWHAWEPGSLGRTNELLALRAEFSAPPSVLPLIERGKEMEELSDGLFNPALGKLIAAWGFHQDEPGGPPPDDDTLEALLEDPPSMLDVERNGVRLRGQHADLQLDFGGLAKGLAVERMLDLLQGQGVEAAIFNAGGDLMTLGRPADRPWRVAIRHPQGGILGSIELDAGEALFSSGDYERGYEWEGEHIHHVIDPRSGRPSEGIHGATVLHSDPALADAAATTLMIAGPEEWPRYARKMGIEAALVVLDDRIEATPAMAERVRLEEGQPSLEERQLP